MGNVPSGALAQAAPIHNAAAMDDVDKLRLLLAEGEDVNAVDKVRQRRERRGGRPSKMGSSEGLGRAGAPVATRACADRGVPQLGWVVARSRSRTDGRRRGEVGGGELGERERTSHLFARGRT